jgi:aminotransferase
MSSNDLFVSAYARNYPASGIRKMFDLLPQYPDVVNLCNGEPDFRTPDHIVAAAIEGLKGGLTKYSQTTGIPALREAVADKYSRQFGRPFRAENVMITAGGTEALLMVLMTTVDPGDEVIVTDPCYPNYFSQIELVRAKAVQVPVYEDDGFKIDPVELEKRITPKTRAVILNYPNNPLGCSMTEDYAAELAAVIRRHNLLVFSDEVYEALNYNGLSHYSPAQNQHLQDRVLVMNSLSKTYAMTGWRVGYVVGPEALMNKMYRLQESVVSCLPVFVQHAAVTALRGSQDCATAMAGEYEERMNLLVDGIGKIPGFSCQRPNGGLCVMTNVKVFNKTSEELAMELLEKAGVMTVPGSAFGPEGEGYIRFCFANSKELIRKGVARIAAYVSEAYPELG